MVSPIGNKEGRRGRLAHREPPGTSREFPLQKGLISETMQQTADDPGLAPAADGGFDCPWTEAISSAGSATRYSDSGQKE